MNLLYMLKNSYMFRPPFMAFFIEVLYEGYVTKTSQTMCQNKILRFKIYGSKYIMPKSLLNTSYHALTHVIQIISLNPHMK